jgi:hypothetical protein
VADVLELIDYYYRIGKRPTSNSTEYFHLYKTSLHYTNQGLAHWYAKENGGLERITGIPFSEMASCNRCHVRTCDVCHVKEVDGKPFYSLAAAKSEAACEKCHAIESQDFARKNPADKTADVHFAKGMKCMDCHTAREIHGDGTPYESIQAPGALDQPGAGSARPTGCLLPARKAL